MMAATAPPDERPPLKDEAIASAGVAVPCRATGAGGATARTVGAEATAGIPRERAPMRPSPGTLGFSSALNDEDWALLMSFVTRLRKNDGVASWRPLVEPGQSSQVPPFWLASPRPILCPSATDRAILVFSHLQESRERRRGREERRCARDGGAASRRCDGAGRGLGPSESRPDRRGGGRTTGSMGSSRAQRGGRGIKAEGAGRQGAARSEYSSADLGLVPVRRADLRFDHLPKPITHPNPTPRSGKGRA